VLDGCIQPTVLQKCLDVVGKKSGDGRDEKLIVTPTCCISAPAYAAGIEALAPAVYRVALLLIPVCGPLR